MRTKESEARLTGGREKWMMVGVGLEIWPGITGIRRSTSSFLGRLLSRLLGMAGLKAYGALSALVEDQ